jgi:hypothetical protein
MTTVAENAIAEKKVAFRELRRLLADIGGCL